MNQEQVVLEKKKIENYNFWENLTEFIQSNHWMIQGRILDTGGFTVLG